MKRVSTIMAAFILITMVTVQVTQAQHKHQFQLELFGSSIFYSLGYAYYLTPDVSIGVGFGTAYFNLNDTDTDDFDSVPDSFIDYKNIPITFTYLSGGERNKLELYTGFSVMKLDISLIGLEVQMNNWQLVPTAGVGYRYQRKNWYGGISLGVVVFSGSPALLSELGPILPNWGLRTGFRF